MSVSIVGLVVVAIVLVAVVWGISMAVRSLCRFRLGRAELNCPHCGTQTPADMGTCQHCGQDL